MCTQKTSKTQTIFVDSQRGSVKDLYFQMGLSVLLQDAHSFSQETGTKLCQEVISCKISSRNQVLKIDFKDNQVI